MRRARSACRPSIARSKSIIGTTAVHICFGYAAIIHVRPSGYSFLPELGRVPLRAGLDRDGAVEPRLRGARAACPARRSSSGVIDLAGSRRSNRRKLVASRIRRALPYVDAANLLIAPDCGMKYLPREVAFGKLQAMVAGAQIVRAQLQAGAQSGPAGAKL